MKKDPKTLSSGILFSGSEYGRELPIFEVLERIANLPLGMVTNEAVVLEDDTNKKFICFINAFDVAEKGETIGIGFKMNGKPNESYGLRKISSNSVKLVSISIV